MTETCFQLTLVNGWVVVFGKFIFNLCGNLRLPQRLLFLRAAAMPSTPPPATVSEARAAMPPPRPPPADQIAPPPPPQPIRYTKEFRGIYSRCRTFFEDSGQEVSAIPLELQRLFAQLLILNKKTVLQNDLLMPVSYCNRIRRIGMRIGNDSYMYDPNLRFGN